GIRVNLTLLYIGNQRFAFLYPFKDVGVLIMYTPFHFFPFFNIPRLCDSSGEVDIEGFRIPSFNPLDFYLVSHLFLVQSANI
ncbi:MAG: hypothetical protein ACOYN4_21435, partial [Bacteroidales bacterium]